MKKVLIPIFILCGFSFSDVFMTELTDPQNSSDAGRYVELYNNGDSDVDLSTWSVQRWTNGNADPTASSIVSLSGTIAAGGFYIICNDDNKFTTTYGLDCHLDIGTGGFADSNGDDNMALLDASGSIVDMFGVAGEDGSGTGHEFEDGRAERAADNTSASATWDETGWNIDNDSGGGDGNQYAPEGFDPGSWIGASAGGDDGGSTTCDDESACNTGDEGDCTYPADSCTACDGSDLGGQDCAGTCGGNAVVDECGECGGDGSSCFEPEPAANLFFSEASEGSSNNKYLEIYNAESADVDLSGYSLSSCSNGCDEVGFWDFADNVTFEAGTIVAAGDVYVICHGSSSDEILAECDQTFTYLSNGDDVFALTQVGTGASLDVIGIVGEDPGSGWDVAGVSDATKDHTLVRKSDVTTGNPRWLDNPDTGEQGSAGDDADDSEWVVFDQNTWDYVGFHPHDFSADVPGCTDDTACNYNSDATVDDGTCALNDCNGDCGGTAVEDDCGVCEGDGTSCSVNVIFSVDMNVEGVVGDVKVRTSTVNGDYSPSDWFVMDDSDGDLVFTYTMTLAAGVTYGYNFNNSDGSGYESGSGLDDCAGGNYGNDRYVTADADTTLDTVCWESCEACPEEIPGCTDESALNYDENATVDDGSCMDDWPNPEFLFFSEYAEGSSNNKYLEIYNADDVDVDLSGYSLSSCSNGCDDGVNWDYPDNVTFEAGTLLAPGDVYVVCHGSAADEIQAECDQTFTYLSNGDDVFALTQMGSGASLDVIGIVGEDPGSGWDVAGVSNATKDHTLVRKALVLVGNGGYWEFSAGSSDDDSEWVVLDQNDWTYLGSHPHDFSPSIGECFDPEDYTAGDPCPGYADQASCESDDSCYWEDDEDSDAHCTYDGPPTCVWDCEGICEFTGEDENQSQIDFCTWMLATLVEGGCSSDCDAETSAGLSDAAAQCELCLEDGDTNSTACDIWGDCAYNGDANGDWVVNVTDVVVIVGLILDGGMDVDECTMDVNQDGMVNVTDVVVIVNTILGGSASTHNNNKATEATIELSNNNLSVLSEGCVQGVEMTLSHDNDIEISLVDADCMHCYSASNQIDANTTKVLVVRAGAECVTDLGSIVGDYDISGLVMSNHEGQTIDSDWYEYSDFKVEIAGPNPFNPSTALNVVVPADGYVSVKIYNLIGQEVATLQDGYMDQNFSGYKLSWNASNLASGVYLVRAESAGTVSLNKLMLLK